MSGSFAPPRRDNCKPLQEFQHDGKSHEPSGAALGRPLLADGYIASRLPLNAAGAAWVSLITQPPSGAAGPVEDNRAEVRDNKLCRNRVDSRAQHVRISADHTGTDCT
jgi:hypothetical protein